MKKLLSCLTVVVFLAVALIVYAGQNDRFSPIELSDVTATTSGKDLLTKKNVEFDTATKIIKSATDYNTGMWTLSTTEAKATVLVVSSGSSGGTFSIVAPAIAGKLFIVRVKAGSPQLATVKIGKSGGATITVAVGKTALVMYDGTDYRRLTADANTEF
jgi:hypothetical protein